MTDNHAEALTVDLGGQRRTLKLSAGAIRLAQVRHGLSLTPAMIEEVGQGLPATLTWVALLPDNPDLTESDALVWIAQLSPDEEERVTRHVLNRYRAVTQVQTAAFKEWSENGAVPKEGSPA